MQAGSIKIENIISMSISHNSQINIDKNMDNKKCNIVYNMYNVIFFTFILINKTRKIREPMQ